MITNFQISSPPNIARTEQWLGLQVLDAMYTRNLSLFAAANTVSDGPAKAANKSSESGSQ